MKKSVSYVLIEAFVRRVLRDIQDSPRRSVRNLIDMALNFSIGRFQKMFFQSAQQMLTNEDSSYYDLIEDVVNNVDHERLLNFGMNLGYNSCVVGAKRIRELEAQRHYNIPWSVTMIMNPERMETEPDRYLSLIEQGKELGIYTWFLFVPQHLLCVKPLLDQYPNCAFVLFCKPEQITPEALEALEPYKNVMIAVRLEDGADQACALLRKHRQLYSIYALYTEENAEEICSTSNFGWIEDMHPVFIALIANDGCTQSVQREVHKNVLESRMQQRIKAVLWDLVGDGLAVDRVISEDECFVGFDKDLSNLSSYSKPDSSCSLLDHTLEEVLKANCPKAPGKLQRDHAVT